MNQLELFNRFKGILERLFGSDWFRDPRNKNHPAYSQWSLCEKVINQGGTIKFPEQQFELPEIARLLLDAANLVVLSEGNLQQFILGSLDLYGNGEIQKQIRNRIRDSAQFVSFMVEVYTAAWHKTRKHDVTLIERDGYPDLRAESTTIKFPIFLECKRLRQGQKKNIHQALKKANKQLKKAAGNTATPTYGVVVLDVSIPGRVGQVSNDDIPATIKEIVEHVESAIHVHNKSISAVVLTWDDYMILGAPPKRTGIFFRRHPRLIRHKNARVPIPVDLPIFEGFTTAYSLNWSPRQPTTGRYVFSPFFQKECQEKLGVGKEETLDAVKSPDKEERVLFNSEKELMFFSKRRPSAKGDVYFVGCAEHGFNQTVVLWGLRIRSDLSKELSLLSPIQLITRLVDKFGLRITLGDLTKSFIFSHNIRVRSSDPMEIIKIHNPENHSFMASFMLKIVPASNGDYIANCALLFCLDTTRYLGWLSE